MSDPTDSVQRMITAGVVARRPSGEPAGGAAATALAVRAAERTVGAAMPGDAVAALGAAVDVLVAAEWWRCGQESLSGAVVEVERQAARLDAARLRLLAEADARGLATQAGATSTGTWFAHATTSRHTLAGARVGLAVAINGRLAATGDALAAGALSVDHAGVIHRAMNQLPADLDPETRARCEGFLVEQSATFDPGDVAVMGTRLRRALVDDDGRAADQEEGRLLRGERFSMVCDEDGSWQLRGVLAPESGAKLAAALDPLSAPAPTVAGVHDARPAGRRRAHALVHLADVWLSGADTTGPAAWTAEAPTIDGAHDPGRGAFPGVARTHMSVTVPITGVVAARSPGATPGCLEGGYPISPATLAAMACDAVITPVLVDGAGSPLDVGQRQYAFPKRIRAAIAVRDRHCTFPGCRRPPAWCQVHHLTTYSSGGPTSERNGTLLCGYHHRLVHARGWRGETEGARVIWHPSHRDDPHVPPPPWAAGLQRIIDGWRAQWTGPAQPRAA